MGFLMNEEQLRQISEHWKMTRNKCGDKWDIARDGGYVGYRKLIKHYDYQVIYEKTPVHEELIWCAENCEGRFYRTYTPPKHPREDSDLHAMCFEKEIDAVAFKLRWL